MALIQNYKLKISYALSTESPITTDYDPKTQYQNILSEEQLTQIVPSIDKEFVISNAYYRIDRVAGTKNDLQIALGIYANASDEILIENKLYTFSPSVDENSENFIKQGYEHLKSLPEFSEAIDA